MNENGLDALDPILDLLRQGKYDQGIAALEKLDQQDPDNPLLLYNLGMAYSDIGALDRAIRVLGRTVELNPSWANAIVALAVAHARKGESRQAEPLLRRALELEPENPWALRNLGAIRARRGDPKEGLGLLEQANRLLPNDPQTLYGLASVHRELGNDEAADEYLKQILSISAPVEIVELAKTMRREVAERAFKSKGLRVDAVFYCLAALQHFAELPKWRVREITHEIALLGRGGLDIHDPERKYRLRSLDGERSGLELLCWMYVGFKQVETTADIGFDLSAEYDAASSLFEAGQGVP